MPSHNTAMMKPVYLTFIFFFVLSSCPYHSQDVKRILTAAENLIETCPDSALVWLESLRYPYELNESLFADYVLLSVWAKDKAYKPIANDTSIFQVDDYFRTKGNWGKATLAAFYSGRVYQEQKNYEEALNAYLAAETLSKSISDENRKGLIQYFIGELYYDQLSYLDAIKRFQSAYEYFSKVPDNYSREVMTLNIIGNSYFLAQQKESALIYFDKALKLSEDHPDLNALTRHNLGVAFLAINETSVAKNELFHALCLASDTDLQVKIHLSLSKIYEKGNQLDSALYFSSLAVELFKEQQDESALASAYRLLSRLEEKNGNPDLALHYHQQYVHYYDRVKDEKVRVHLLELQEKYDFELIKGINNRLVIQRQWGILSSMVLVIAIFLISFFYYHHNQQNKNALSEARQTTYQLKEMMNNKDNAIHAFMIKEFDVVKKISLLEGYLIETEKGKDILKKVNKIIYEKDSFDWEVLYQVMNKLYKGYLDKITTTFPDLSELEYKICCLTKSGLNNTEIAIILKTNVNIIQIRKTAIRKKLKILKHGDITKFMDGVIS